MFILDHRYGSAVHAVFPWGVTLGGHHSLVELAHQTRLVTMRAQYLGQ